MSNQHSKNPAQQFWAWYKKQIETHPLRTQALTSATLSFTGNVVAQKIIQRTSLDLARTLKFALWGIVGAPIFYNWHKLLNRSFKGKSGKNVVLAKVLMDQLLMAPVALSIFYFFMALLDGNPLSAKKTISEQLFPTLKGSWKLWPAAQLINFSLVPPQFRTIFGSLVGFVWNIMLTLLSNRTVKAIAKN